MEQATFYRNASLGRALALWAQGLDRQDELVDWWLQRAASSMHEPQGTTRTVHETFQQLRRRIAPYLQVAQVLKLDQLLADPQWHTAAPAELRAEFDAVDEHTLLPATGAAGAWQGAARSATLMQHAGRVIDLHTRCVVAS